MQSHQLCNRCRDETYIILFSIHMVKKMCKWFDLYYFEIIAENKQIGKRMDGTFICESIAKLNFIRHTSTCICILRIIECHDINLKLKEHFFFGKSLTINFIIAFKLM